MIDEKRKRRWLERSSDEVEIQRADPEKPEIRAILEAHIAHGDAHYPAESNHHFTADDHLERGTVLFAAWRSGKCLGIAALKKLDVTSGELKSMHVLEDARGHRIGARLLERVISDARQKKLVKLYLETGSREASAAARLLYENFGFTHCPPFADYREDIESVFMELEL